MARGTPTFFSGSITGTNNVEDLYSQLETRIKAYQSNGGDAWEEWDVITATAGSRNIVFRSLGDRTLVTGAGDATMFINMQQINTTTIDFYNCQDYSDSANSFSRKSGARRWSSLNASNDIDYWGVSNEYEFAFVFVQGGSYKWVHFGQPRRTHIPPSLNGIAFTSNAETSGASVVIEVDRDISSNITVGQKICIYNITPTATALRNATVDFATVDAVTSGSITVDTLSNNKDAGAIIGLDPCPFFLTVSTTGSATYYFPHFANGVHSGADSQTAEQEIMIERFFSEGNIDPSVLGFYYGSEVMLENTDGTNGTPRGTLELVTYWPKGTQADADRMLSDYDDTTEAWKIFPTLDKSGWSLSFGPGATA